MAKESMKAREVKRAKLAKRYQHKRDEIAAKVKSGEMDHEEAWIALSKLPRNSNPIRQHNRCKLTGRPKGYIRQFGISRIQFREMASNGLIPGVKKASWQCSCLSRPPLRRDSLSAATGDGSREVFRTGSKKAYSAGGRCSERCVGSRHTERFIY